ncbi:hypothetical protein ACFYKX_03410 [Cytobacillus sp. FJAT-54145]|uniref:Uncharacterized protein n=1 Tax=Cytobacillus spartinae TaxID=3299023 RepID=A0ABW6KA38_9BACI
MTKRDVLVGIAVAVLIIFNIIHMNKIRVLNEKLQMFEYMQHEIQNVHDSVGSISYNMDTKLEEFMQEQLWVAEKTYKVHSVDLEKNTIDVLIEWSLRDLVDGEEISFLYREAGEENWTELDVTKKEGLNYSLEYTFPLKGNFETQVVATANNGTRSESLLDLNFKEQLNSRISIHSFFHNTGDGHVDMNFDIQNRLDQELPLTKNKEELKMKSAMAYFYLDGKVIKEIDLLNPNYNRNNGHYNFHSDSHFEGINFNHFLNLEEEVGKDIEDVELRIIVKDGLGLTYETIAEHNK